MTPGAAATNMSKSKGSGMDGMTRDATAITGSRKRTRDGSAGPTVVGDRVRAGRSCLFSAYSACTLFYTLYSRQSFFAAIRSGPVQVRVGAHCSTTINLEIALLYG